MDYLQWRSEVFGQPAGSDPVTLEFASEMHQLSHGENLDHIDRALGDPEIHQLYSKDQIGVGLMLIYENSCSNIVFCYLEGGDDARRVQGIRRLELLYTNYFDRYCQTPVDRVGYSCVPDGRIGYLCYMLWDVFVLYPGNASPAMLSAAMDVMAKALRMKNDNCLVSAIHGLGHWAMDEPRAVQIMEKWLLQPTTQNPEIIGYAHQATTGSIQ